MLTFCSCSVAGSAHASLEVWKSGGHSVDSVTYISALSTTNRSPIPAERFPLHKTVIAADSVESNMHFLLTDIPARSVSNKTQKTHWLIA